jgi:hypothetical protein
VSPTKDADLARLEELADRREELKLLYDEQCVIWDRRIRAGDCAESNQPKDRGQSALARVSRVARAQIIQGTDPVRLAQAKEALAAAHKRV